MCENLGLGFTLGITKKRVPCWRSPVMLLRTLLSLPFSSRFHFQGPCGTTLPEALAPHETENVS